MFEPEIPGAGNYMADGRHSFGAYWSHLKCSTWHRRGLLVHPHSWRCDRRAQSLSTHGEIASLLIYTPRTMIWHRACPIAGIIESNLSMLACMA